MKKLEQGTYFCFLSVGPLMTQPRSTLVAYGPPSAAGIISLGFKASGTSAQINRSTQEFRLALKVRPLFNILLLQDFISTYGHSWSGKYFKQEDRNIFIQIRYHQIVNESSVYIFTTTASISSSCRRPLDAPSGWLKKR